MNTFTISGNIIAVGASFERCWSAVVFVMQVTVMSHGGSGNWASDERRVGSTSTRVHKLSVKREGHVMSD